MTNRPDPDTAAYRRTPIVLGDPTQDPCPDDTADMAAPGAPPAAATAMHGDSRDLASQEGQDKLDGGMTEGTRRAVEQWESLGVPDQSATAENSRPLSSEEIGRLKYAAEPERAEADEETDLELGLWQRTLGRPLLIAILLAFGSTILLFLLSQFLLLFNQLVVLPGWLRPIGYGGVGLLIALTLAATISAVRSYFRLKKSQRISLRALATLRQRARLRAHKKLQEARDSLGDLLREYPLSEKSDETRLHNLGATLQQIENLASSQRWLLEKTAGASDAWIEEFNNQFLHVLDQIADQRIWVYAKRLAIQTGAAHQQTIDTIIVTMNAYMLVGDLCVIYNVRAGKWETAKILAHVFVNTFAASRVDQWSDAVADHAANWFSQHLPHAANAAGQLVKDAGVGIVSKVMPRIGSGAANGMLLYRLGKATVRELRPVQEKPGNG